MEIDLNWVVRAQVLGMKLDTNRVMIYHFQLSLKHRVLITNI